MRVLVTGHEGYLGFVVVPRLRAAGHEVVGLDTGFFTECLLGRLMGAGAARATVWVQIGWAAALIPVLWAATSLDGIRGAAVAHAGVGVLVAIPLAALAVKGIGVDVARMGPGLVRPLAAGALAGVIATVAANLVGHTRSCSFSSPVASACSHTFRPRCRARSYISGWACWAAGGVRMSWSDLNSAD